MLIQMTLKEENVPIVKKKLGHSGPNKRKILRPYLNLEVNSVAMLLVFFLFFFCR